MSKRKLGIPVSVLVFLILLLVSSCKQSSVSSVPGRFPAAPPGLTLSIKNGRPEAPLDLVAGQEYIFDRVILEVEGRNINESREALDWLTKQSSFRVLDWNGVRETGAYWQNYKGSRPEADIFSHIFEGAAWTKEANSLELSVLDDHNSALGNPLRISSEDFLNHLKQWDFDMIKAEFRYDNFIRSKEKSSAKEKRAVPGDQAIRSTLRCPVHLRARYALDP